MNGSSPHLLSILTPAVPSRLAQLEQLASELARQIGTEPVEHLILLDNKRRTVGEKRDNLLRLARGKYVAFVDDDDWIAPDYIQRLCAVIAGAEQPDVITFRQGVAVNDLCGEVEFRLGHPNEPFRIQIDGSLPVKRNAWHVCAWQRSLAVQSRFPASNYGEDWAYAAPLCAAARSEVHIPRILHYYRHDEKTTEAPPPAAL